MENTIKSFKEQSTELAKKLARKRNTCISKQDVIRDLWHGTEQNIRYMEDNTNALDVDAYNRMCDNTYLYSKVNQHIERQIDAIDDIIRALDEIEAHLEELDYQESQIRLYERRIER